MPLLDELRNALRHHHLHVTAQTNQGTAPLIESHIARLDAAAGDVEKGTAEAHRVLGELYSALDAPAPEAPASAAKTAAKKAAAPADTDKA